MIYEFEKIFPQDGTPFGALYAAENWLRENGYSCGSSCVFHPQAIKKGEWCIAKWRNLTQAEKEDIDGILVAGRDKNAIIKLLEEPR
jgi:hypothetical protein